MTPGRLDTILANLDPEERGELVDRIVGELTHAEIVDALTHVWDRIRPRVVTAYSDYLDEVARIDAEAIADSTCRRCARPLNADGTCTECRP